MIDERNLEPHPSAFEYRTKQSIVTDFLRSSILSGRIGPGTRLNQDDIANQLGVSRMPVRESLRILQSEGLIELQPHRSAVVISLQEEDIAEIFGIRAMLEAKAAELAAPQLNEATLAHLREVFQEMDELVNDQKDEGLMPLENLTKWNSLNREFHRTIFSACGWPRLQAMIEAQLNALAPYHRMWDSSFAAPALSARAIRFHKAHTQILRAAESPDGERLARLISEHVSSTGRELIAFLSIQQSEAKSTQSSADDSE